MHDSRDFHTEGLDCQSNQRSASGALFFAMELMYIMVLHSRSSLKPLTPPLSPLRSRLRKISRMRLRPLLSPLRPSQQHSTPMSAMVPI